jgi:hypothetical protein
MRTDGQTERRTDMTKIIVAFRNFANASKNEYGVINWIELSSNRAQFRSAGNTVRIFGFHTRKRRRIS